MAHRFAIYPKCTMACTWSFIFTVLQVFSLFGSIYTNSFNSNQLPENNNADVSAGTKPCCENNSKLQSIGKIESSFSHNVLTRIVANSKDNIPITTSTTTRPTTSSSYVIRSNANDERPAARFCNRFGWYYENLERAPRQDINAFINPFFYEGECKTNRLYVAGGKPVERGLSHVVALGTLNEEEQFSFHCGGSLVSWEWVLTAAHCTHGFVGGATIARVGTRRLSDNNAHTIRIKRTIRHPSYKPPALYADIALLELETPVLFSETLKPACLPVRDDYWLPYVTVCGWGATEFEGDESDTLQEAYLQILDNVECELKHNHSIAVPDGVAPSMICAGSFRSARLQDTCRGDSGGPLQTAHNTWSCLNEIIGITSFGTGCAFIDTPGVYTRVSYYLKWIEDIVWPNYAGI